MNSTPLPILYTFKRCPYAMRARMAIHQAGIAVNTIEVSLKNKPQCLLDYSPKGTVPVVVTQEGEVIDQSRDIMLWALKQNDVDNWLLADDPSLQQQMTSLMDKCDFEFKPWLDRYKYADRYPDASQLDYRTKAEFFLRILEEQLHQHAFLTDDQLRLSDIAIFPFIRQLAGVDKTWFYSNGYTKLQRWLDVCIDRDVFKAVMV